MTSTVVERAIAGHFDLRQSITFGFGHRVADEGTTMRLAFVLDGYREQVGVAVTQPDPALLRFDVTSEDDPEAAADQAARVLSVDIDGTAFDALVGTDRVLSRVRRKRPGLRPPLFYSAYEALLWAVLSARRPAPQMAQLRTRLAAAHGRSFDVAGQELPAMPTPEQLLQVREFDGLPEVKLRRMHAIAEAARDGQLDTAALRARNPDEVAAELRHFDGIGPFYSDLVTVRALGHTDALPLTEPRVISATAELLGRPGLTPAEFTQVAERWRPWRTWACVAIRAAS